MKKSIIGKFPNSGNISEVQALYKTTVRNSERQKIGGSKDCYDILKSIWSPHLERIEEFIILLLNRANRVQGWVKISQGGVSGTVVDPKVIFQMALAANSSSIILAHNHPSGNCQPSEADMRLTKKITDGGKLLDIVVLDHLIITDEAFYSFADEGKM